MKKPLSPIIRQLLPVLQDGNPRKTQELLNYCNNSGLNVSVRTLRNELRRAADAGLISRTPDLFDLRSHYYSVEEVIL